MNPFSYGTVVKGEYFYDRSEELDRITTTLLGGNNLVLFAPRRFGKTSLVFRAMDLLQKREGIKCIYFDFLPVYSRTSFIEGYTKAIYSAQKDFRSGITKIARWVKGIRPKLSFDPQGNPEFSIDFTEDKLSEKTLEDVLDLPEKLAKDGERIIIVIDEFQEITKLNGENFEKLFRSKIQFHEKVNYLFLGSRTHILNDMFNNKNRAFYNAAMIMQIGPLPLKDSIEFLKTRFAGSRINIDEQTAEYLIKEAGDIPYYIQLLAAEVWQQVMPSKTDVSSEIIDLCAKRIIEVKGDFYFELFEKVSTYQKRILKALLTEEENIFSGSFTKRHSLSGVSSTQKAISGLVQEGIVEKSGNRYFISDPFFKRFLVSKIK
jgi:hypothetical protein